MFEKKKKENIEAEVERLDKEMMEKFRKEKTGKKTSRDMEIPKTKKKRRLLDEDHVQRKRRRIIPDRLKDPDPVDGREILDDWTAWWDWLTEHCSRTSRFSDFRRFLEFDRARVLRRMECLEVEVIIADMSVWWKHLEEQIQHQQAPAYKMKASKTKKNKFQYQRDGREERERRKQKKSSADWSLKLCGWNI
jgi:hypothetical protein